MRCNASGLALALAATGCVDVSGGGVSVYVPLPAGMMQRAMSLSQEGAPLAVAGPYGVVVEPAFGSPEHLVYRPASLDAFPAEDTLPVLAWANGGCVADGEGYAGYLTTLASYGFLVVTSAPTGGSLLIDQVSAADLIAGVDWAEKENARDGSPLFGKIDAASVAVMGQSCGGWLAIAVASDPRIDTIGVWNAGVSRQGRGSYYSGLEERAGRLAEIRGPTLYIDGHDRDHASPAAAADYEAIKHVPIFYGSLREGGHMGTIIHPGGGEFANVGAAWLMWRLKGDEVAGGMFMGEECGLCADPDWVVRRKGWE